MTDKNKKSREPDDNDNTSLAPPGFGFPSVFEDLVRPFDEIMQPFFDPSMGSFWTELKGREPSIDVQDRGDHYLITAELPGFEKKDLEAQIGNNVLVLKGDRSSDRETKDKDGTRTHSSRSYFHRSMTLPQEVVSEKATGTMKNGVLELKLPKRAPKAGDKPKRVDLK